MILDNNDLNSIHETVQSAITDNHNCIFDLVHGMYFEVVIVCKNPMSGEYEVLATYFWSAFPTKGDAIIFEPMRTHYNVQLVTWKVFEGKKPTVWIVVSPIL